MAWAPDRLERCRAYEFGVDADTGVAATLERLPVGELTAVRVNSATVTVAQLELIIDSCPKLRWLRVDRLHWQGTSPRALSSRLPPHVALSVPSEWLPAVWASNLESVSRLMLHGCALVGAPPDLVLDELLLDGVSDGPATNGLVGSLMEGAFVSLRRVPQAIGAELMEARPRLAGLELVELPDVDSEFVTRLSACGILADLGELRLARVAVGAGILTKLGTGLSTRCERLSLRQLPGLDDEALVEIADAAGALVELDVGWSGVTGAGVFRGLVTDGATVEVLGLDSISGVPHCLELLARRNRALTRLSAVSTDLDGESFELLGDPECFPRLEVLMAADSSIGQIRPGARLEFRSLKQLDVSHTRLARAGGGPLFGADALPKLEALHCAGCVLADADAQALADWLTTRTVRDVDLSEGIGLSDATIAALIRAAAPDVVRLNLSVVYSGGTGIGGGFADTRFPYLAYLTLSETMLTPDQVAAFGRADMPQLLELEIALTDDAGLTELRSIPQLSTLGYLSVRVDEAGDLEEDAIDRLLRSGGHISAACAISVDV